MKSLFSSSSAILLILFLITSQPACSREKSAADTIEPVKQYFESLTDREVVSPDLSSIEDTVGVILTWQVTGDGSEAISEYSWVLARNTDDLMRALIIFDHARAWNTETYIFLPVSLPAGEVHEEVGLSVPQSIYDEDGMNRIRELVLSGETPEGGFVEQFEQFME